jgi:hypothetical protein
VVRDKSRHLPMVKDRSRIESAAAVVLALLLIASFSMSAIGQEKQTKREAQKIQDLNMLIEKAKALDEKVYPPYVSGGPSPANDDFIAFREEVDKWAKAYKVRWQLMRDFRPIKPHEGLMRGPQFYYLVNFYGMTCFLKGNEFSHSTFMGYYSCIS